MTDDELKDAAHGAFESAMAFGVDRHAFEKLARTVRDACAKPPAVLFDGFAVLQALDEKAKARTSAENVSDVLDAVVRLMRSNVK